MTFVKLPIVGRKKKNSRGFSDISLLWWNHMATLFYSHKVVLFGEQQELFMDPTASTDIYKECHKFG